MMETALKDHATPARFLLLSILLLGSPAALAADLPGGDPRVVNGVPTQSRPTTGALLLTDGTGNYGLACSGTLIGCRTFLTAAHCVCDGSTSATCGTPDPAGYAVFLQNVGIASVASIDVHPSYDFGTSGDVAVITLGSTTTGVPPARINTTGRPPLGTTAEIVGFGLTQGGADDTGLLRRGLTNTASCTNAGVDSANHVCWNFASPLGPAGTDSNTCNADSGGPLFADLGGGSRVIGITSGGSSSKCLPTDSSFDADVYVHRAFIQGVAGADLSNTSCGAISQVGDSGTVVQTASVAQLTSAGRSCRQAVGKVQSTYVAAVLKATRACLDDMASGRRPGPCPDAATNDAVAKATARIGSGSFAKKCPDAVVPTIGATGACASASDTAGLAACIATAGRASVDLAVASEYADTTPSGPMADANARSCQRAIGDAGSGLLNSSLKALSKCAVLQDAGRIATCPDSKASSSVAKAESKLASLIDRGCSNAVVAGLAATGSGFGGSCAGASTSAGLIDCETADHAAIADGLIGLIDPSALQSDFSFAVPAGTSRLRFVLNGLEGPGYDLDLYVRRGAPATPGANDGASLHGGMFEAIEIVSPTAGTWYAHVDTYAGPARIPFQLTVTSFAP